MLRLFGLPQVVWCICLFIGLCGSPLSAGDDPGRDVTADPPADPPDMIKSILPASGPAIITAPAHEGVDWRGLFGASIRFLSIEHAFRLATEPGTREGLQGKFIPDYAAAVGNLHGWGDGDPFIVNYIGHPMQGAVAGGIWSQNDRKYRRAEFGRNSVYWKGKLRATAFAWFYSTQFEVGPVSEASLGNIQSFYPQQGFVDHVITPTFGLGWMVAEDAIDKYIIKAVEGRTTNAWVRLLVRGGLNPSRSFANAMGGRLPWARDTRAGVRAYRAEPGPATEFAGIGERRAAEGPQEGPAPFEFAVAPVARAFVGAGARGSCLGGGASGAFRLSPQWQIVADVSGCNLEGLPDNVSGDLLSFTAGPRWSRSAGRWSPYVQMLAGGNKFTTERVYPAAKAALQAVYGSKELQSAWRDKYTSTSESTGFALEAGTGVSFKVNEALAVHVASLDYTHAWVGNLNGIAYASGLQFKTGVVLRVGTW